jgi:glycosyltransferase involved in cell wall biosynthesis
MLAPPWIPIPAPGYGGIEAVVEVLTGELVRLGHEVKLFAAPGSRSEAAVIPLLEAPHPHEIGAAEYEADHVARAFDAIDAAGAHGWPFDVVHDHCGFTALAMANRLEVPLVHTIHGAFSPDNRSFYGAHAAKAELVTISRKQRLEGPSAVGGTWMIPNPIRIREWEFSAHKGRHLVWLGRMTDYKGPHRAIDVAAAAGRRIVLAGPVQPGQEAFFAEEVEPRLAPPAVSFVGEVKGKAKQRFLAGAAALLMPIRWSEPFGMVMIEALAAGTPVIAFPEGAAEDIVVDGVNGFLVQDEDEMAAAVQELAAIDPYRCRASVASRYDVAAIARRYLEVYRHACGRVRAGGRQAGRRVQPRDPPRMPGLTSGA